MTVKKLQPAIMVLLVLVFQLGQVLSAAMPSGPCQDKSVSMSCCCSGEKTCHCAQNNDSEQVPKAPLVDSGETLKLPLIQPSGRSGLVSSSRICETPLVGTSNTVVEHPTGFVGVCLPIAFCSFVI
jgi:hypothetical protein